MASIVFERVLFKGVPTQRLLLPAPQSERQCSTVINRTQPVFKVRHRNDFNSFIFILIHFVVAIVDPVVRTKMTKIHHVTQRHLLIIGLQAVLIKRKLMSPIC